MRRREHSPVRRVDRLAMRRRRPRRPPASRPSPRRAGWPSAAVPAHAGPREEDAGGVSRKTRIFQGMRCVVGSWRATPGGVVHRFMTVSSRFSTAWASTRERRAVRRDRCAGSRGASPTARSFAARRTGRSGTRRTARGRAPRGSAARGRPAGGRSADRRMNAARSARSRPLRGRPAGPGARAASTYWGSFSRTRAWSGVAVGSRLTAQTSRLVASKVSMAGGGEVRFQNV